MDNALGNKLRSYRSLVGLTLKDVAHFTGISLSFLSDMERGRTQPSIATLKRLATFYKVSVDTLLDDMHTPVASAAIGVDDFSDSLALHDDPFGVLASLAEMEDVEAGIRWANSLE